MLLIELRRISVKRPTIAVATTYQNMEFQRKPVRAESHLCVTPYSLVQERSDRWTFLETSHKLGPLIRLSVWLNLRPVSSCTLVRMLGEASPGSSSVQSAKVRVQLRKA